MSAVGIIIGICILGIGIWTAQNNKSTVTTNVETEMEATITPSSTEVLTPSETPDIDNPTKVPTNSPTQMPTATTKPNNNSSSFSLSGFQYPGASVNSSSQTRMELTTVDSPTTVTDWYKNKINSTGMNAKSFVTTSANDNVVNKLVAAGNGTEISVDITKSPSDSSVKIVVELK